MGVVPAQSKDLKSLGRAQKIATEGREEKNNYECYLLGDRSQGGGAAIVVAALSILRRLQW